MTPSPMPCELIGRTGLVRHADPRDKTATLEYSVRVLEWRRRFGRLDLLVEPVAGRGNRWMSAENVTLRGD